MVSHPYNSAALPRSLWWVNSFKLVLPLAPFTDFLHCMNSTSVCNQLPGWTQHCIPLGLYIDYRPVWLGLRQNVFSCVRWQVTLCDPIRQALRWRFTLLQQFSIHQIIQTLSENLWILGTDQPKGHRQHNWNICNLMHNINYLFVQYVGRPEYPSQMECPH